MVVFALRRENGDTHVVLNPSHLIDAPAQAVKAVSRKGNLMRYLISLLALLLLAGPLGATEMPGNCKVEFFGSSTLHDFEGTGLCKPFALQLDSEATGRAGVPGGIRVEVSSMQTGNSARDEKMRDMFQAGSWPVISAAVTDVDFVPVLTRLRQGGEEPFTFTLRIRDVERTVSGRISHAGFEGENLAFDLDFELSLKAFGLKPPGVLGIIRVSDAVRVRVRGEINGVVH